MKELFYRFKLRQCQNLSPQDNEFSHSFLYILTLNMTSYYIINNLIYYKANELPWFKHHELIATPQFDPHTQINHPDTSLQKGRCISQAT